MALVIDGLVSAATLRRQAAPDEYAAAEDLVGDVTDLVLERGRAAGTLNGPAGPTAALDWSSGELSGGCSCRDDRQTSLCRHVAAVGLAALEHARGQTVVTPPPPPSPASSESPSSSVEQWLTTLDQPDLTSLTLELAALTQEGTRLLQTRAALATGATDVIEAELLDLVGSALRTGGVVDYRRSFRVGHDASAVLDELEAHLDAGRADLTISRRCSRRSPACAGSSERADDSSGVDR